MLYVTGMHVKKQQHAISVILNI